MHQQRLAHNVQQRHARVERRKRVLKDHLHLATERLHLIIIQHGNIHDCTAVRPKENLSRRRVYGAQDAARSRCLATTAFPHQRKRLAFIDIERDIIHCADKAHNPL